jgi:hypothetical protein
MKNRTLMKKAGRNSKTKSTVSWVDDDYVWICGSLGELDRPGHNWWVRFISWVRPITPIAIAILISALSTFFAAATALIAFRALRVSENQFIESVRPWVAVFRSGETDKQGAAEKQGEVLSVPTVDQYGRRTMDLSFWLINVGHSPANVLVSGKLSTRPKDPGNPEFLAENTSLVCSEVGRDFKDQIERAKRKAGIETGIYVLIPDSTPLPYRVANLDVPPSPDGKYVLTFIGCIVYRSTIGDHTIHQTPFMAEIDIDPNGRKEVKDVWMIENAN